jgi:hypothetical protein
MKFRLLKDNLLLKICLKNLRFILKLKTRLKILKFKQITNKNKLITFRLKIKNSSLLLRVTLKQA